jgi:hypothetical protein
VPSRPLPGRAGPGGPLERLARLDATKVFLATLVLAMVGMFLPGVVGAVVLLGIVVALGALLRLTWPATPPRLRLVRLVTLAALTALAITKLL